MPYATTKCVFSWSSGHPLASTIAIFTASASNIGPGVQVLPHNTDSHSLDALEGDTSDFLLLMTGEMAESNLSITFSRLKYLNNS